VGFIAGKKTSRFFTNHLDTYPTSFHYFCYHYNPTRTL